MACTSVSIGIRLTSALVLAACLVMGTLRIDEAEAASPILVTSTIPSYTSIGAAGCSPATPARINFGDVLPGSLVKTSGVYWNGIAQTTAGGTAKVASAAYGVENASVSLRFGFRPSATQRVGHYIAPISFDVVAPNV